MVSNMVDFSKIADGSRVWIYQSDRVFTDEEVRDIESRLVQFLGEWYSHGAKLNAFGLVVHNRFLILANDERTEMVSGCSIDSSVHFVKQIEGTFGVDMFNRMLFSYMENEVVKTAERDDFNTLYNDGKINDQTLVFNNLVDNKADLMAKWLVPLEESWHKRMVGV